MQVGELTFIIISFKVQKYKTDTGIMMTQHHSLTHMVWLINRHTSIGVLFTMCSIQVGRLILVPYEYAMLGSLHILICHAYLI